jgi:recyclin-1
LQVKNHAPLSDAIDGTRQTSDLQARFVTSQNPAQIKQNVLNNFGNVLLLPVTIIPKAVGAVGTVAVTGVQAIGSGVVTGVQAVGSGVATVGSVAVGGAVNGISMLNPTKWGGASKIEEGYTREGESGAVIWSEEMYDDDGEYEPAEDVEEFVGQSVPPFDEDDPWAQPAPKPSSQEKPKPNRRAKSSRASPSSAAFSPVTTLSSTNGSVLPTTDSGATSISKVPVSMDNLDLFLSLDIALELIHATRDSLKRLESFFPPSPTTSAADGLFPSSAAARRAQAPQSTATKPLDRRASLSVEDEDGKYIWSICGFPGQTGVKLRETIQEVFVLLLIALRERHLEPGFNMAVEQMRVWKPLQHPKSSGEMEPKKDEEAVVAPLLGFFELVHVGDTIGSMVQVYFDREMVSAPIREFNGHPH